MPNKTQDDNRGPPIVHNNNIDVSNWNGGACSVGTTLFLFGHAWLHTKGDPGDGGWSLISNTHRACAAIDMCMGDKMWMFTHK